MATKKTEMQEQLLVDGVCNFEIPIDHRGWAVDSERVASYAVAMASLVPRFPSLSFTVTAEGIKASISSQALANDVCLGSLIRGILEAGEEQFKEFSAWKEREARLDCRWKDQVPWVASRIAAARSERTAFRALAISNRCNKALSC